MYIVFAGIKKFFIAGISTEKVDADPKLLPAPHSIKVEQVYPFYIVEDSEGFSCYSKEEAKTAINRHSAESDIIVYTITEDFMPEEPSKDNMGLLEHWHMTKGQWVIL